MNDIPEYSLGRVFEAPRNLVWRAWTDPKIIQHWYGPGVETVIHEFDLKPGGLWLNEMKWGGNSHYQRVEFKEVTPPEKLVWHHASADADWNIVANTMMPDWPLVLLTAVLFEDLGAKTSVRLSQTPINATDAQNAGFAATMSGMDNGWGGGYKLIDEWLEAEQRSA